MAVHFCVVPLTNLSKIGGRMISLPLLLQRPDSIAGHPHFQMLFHIASSHRPFVRATNELANASANSGLSTLRQREEAVSV